MGAGVSSCVHESKMFRQTHKNGAVAATFRCVKCGAVDYVKLFEVGCNGIWIPHAGVPGGVDHLPEWKEPESAESGQRTFEF